MGPPEPPFGEHQPTIPPPGNGSKRQGQEWGPKNGARKQVQKMGPPEPPFGEHQPTILKTSSRIYGSRKQGQKTGPQKLGHWGGRDSPWESHFQKMGSSLTKSPLRPWSDSGSSPHSHKPFLFLFFFSFLSFTYKWITG